MRQIPINEGPDFQAKLRPSENLRAILCRELSEQRPKKILPLAVDAFAAENPASIAHPSDVPAIDLRRLWSCADDDPEELKRLLVNYLQEIESLLEKVEPLIADGAFSELARCAHRCCGASAFLGMNAIAIPLRAMERIEPEQPGQRTCVHLAEARRQLTLIYEFLKTMPETS